MNLADLCARSTDELEALYRDAPLAPPPAGLFRGRLLHYLDNPGARRPLVRAVDWLLFDAPPFGVDFASHRWWFVHPRLQAGHFTTSLGRSRWRAADVVRLNYGESRLPRLVRGLLYDELKPLGDNLCLGIGGVNAEAGQGEHFFFALTREG